MGRVYIYKTHLLEEYYKEYELTNSTIGKQLQNCADINIPIKEEKNN